ncbi:MAG TPA: MFS transporter [Planctomycetota bacterium]|nr:MFS transporter [Planctomycetota bacterium]
MSEGDRKSSGARAWWTVAVLTLAYTFAFVDRQVINLLVTPIKRDLALGDFEMSLLMGLSFALFYTTFGVLIGRLADRTSRRGLAVSGFVVWSAMTAACGLARTYGQLFLARLGVGVGEAALSPAAYSMIADEFERDRRATALGVYSSGIYIGSGLATYLGGTLVEAAGKENGIELPWLGAVRPWQLVFLVLGASGLVAAALFATIREPARRAPVERESWRATFAHYRENARALATHHGGFALLSLAGYGSAAWIPSFLERTHGWSSAKIGQVYGPIIAVAGISGVIAGGRIADLLKRRGVVDANLRVGLAAALLCAPLGLCFPLASDERVCACLLFAFLLASSLPWGVAAAALADTVPDRLRGQVSAIYLFAINAIGLGLGPSLIALTTERGFGRASALNLSLSTVVPIVEIAAALVLFSGLRAYRESAVRSRASRW